MARLDGMPLAIELAATQDQVRSSLDSSHPTLRIGAVAVLGGIWEIVF